ncbi:histidine kinase [Nonomuraea rubra]
MTMPASVAFRVVVTVATLVVALGTYLSGFRHGGNSPILLIPLACAAIVCCVSASALHQAGQARTGRWVSATGWSLLVYLLAATVAAEYAGVRGHGDAVAWTAVTVQAAGYILPVTLTQVCFLVAGGRSERAVRLVLGSGIAFAVLAMVTLPAGEPYARLKPLWELPEAGSLAALPWMASVLAGPVLLWRAVPAERGERRLRLLVVAAASLVPIGTVLLAALAAVMAHAAGVLTVTAGETATAVGFCVPLILCPLVLAAVARPGGARLARRVPSLVGAVVGLLFTLLVVAAAAVLGGSLGAGAVLPVVLSTLAVAAVVVPINRWVVRALLLRVDPVRARAARLVREAGATSRPAETAQDVLRAALGDPTARLVLELPEGRGWVEADGATAPPPPPGAVLIGAHAYLVHQGEAVDAYGGADEVAELVERAVLQAAVRDHGGRAEAAAAEERRRLERDLHDGVQGRLLALALDLRMARRRLRDAEAQLVLTDATDSLAAAIEELRALSTGNVPETLSRHGLRAALSELTGRIPVPVALNVPEARLPPPIESVAYLVVCEAVTNALKHAGAATIEVDVRLDGGCARVSVTDDGSGGADLRAGSGLRGLYERVQAVGGRLVVGDRRPSGTALEATLPCGS